jgi:hypothetical protein
MVNPAMNWFNLKIDEPLETEEPLAELPEVKLWTQNLEQTIFKIFNNPASNFYNQIHEFFLNLAAFGTSIFYVEEDPSITGGLFFRNINLKECYFVEQNQCRDAIYKAFYVDIFRMQKENKEMTAAEVQIRNEEQMRMMAPMVGRIETEALNPLINIVYQILLKYNRLPEIAGLGIPENINPEYVSPLSRAQKSGQINAIEQVLGFFQRSGIVNIAPDIYDNMDWDECFKLFFDLKGAPQSLLKSEQEIMQIRQQRKMMQMQQMQQGQ